MINYNKLLNNLEILKLEKMLNYLPNYLDSIKGQDISIVDVLYNLTEQEIQYRDERASRIQVTVAGFPFEKEVKDFDFTYQPGINKQQILELESLRFIENNENIIFCGTPGVGKTHLAVAIGTLAAIQRYSVYFIPFHELISQLRKAKYENRLETRIKWFCRYKLLIVDEVGYEKMDNDTANLFFNLISKRYEKSSTVITTNLVFSKWPDVFGDPVLTNALLDRLLHHCSVLNINGPSYRLKDQLQYFTEND